MNNIWQCGFTRLGKQEMNAGWQAVPFSKDIHPDALKAYEKIQSQNVAGNAVLDENGNPVRLFEVVGDGRFVYMSWIQYGLEDEIGRKNNMFAHGVILPLSNESVYKSPESFLSIRKENFAKSYVEATNNSGTLLFEDLLTIEQAMENCAVDQNRWTDLIFAVFSAIEQKKPLYVITKDGEHYWKSALFCIYYGLPFGLRKNLSAVSMLVNSGQNRTVVFSKDFGSRDLFFNLETGDNNVLTDRTVNKYKKWGFADYVTSMDDLSQSRDYYERLDEKAKMLGDLQGSTLRVLRVAHQMIICEPAEITEVDELKYRLFEALQTGIEGNEYMDRYICGLLHHVNLGGIELSEATDEELTNYLKATENTELKEEGKIYSAHVMMRQPPEMGRDRLASFSGERFKEYAEELNKELPGQQILDLYYIDKINEAESWDALNCVLEESEAFQGLHKAAATLETKALELYTRELSIKEMQTVALDSYTAFMKKITSPENLSGAIDSAKAFYWESKHLSDFQYALESEYRHFHTPANRKSVSFNALLDACENFKDEKTQGFKESMRSFYEAIGEEEIASSDRNRICNDFCTLVQEAKPSLYKTWEDLIFLAFMAGWLDVDSESMDIGKAVQDNDWQSFESIYMNRVARINDDEIGTFAVMRHYNKLLLHVLEMGDLGNSITLDMWLLMGKHMCINPFDVLDNEEWPTDHLLETDPEVIVDSSVLLADSEFYNLATSYVRSEGSNREKVKVWISERKRLDKAEKKRNAHRHREQKKTESESQHVEAEDLSMPNKTDSIIENKEPEKGLRRLFRRKA